MSLLTALRALVGTAKPCAGCRHFTNVPDLIERELRGLSILSSAHASVRGNDGLCRLHDRIINGGYRCAAFTPDRA